MTKLTTLAQAVASIPSGSHIALSEKIPQWLSYTEEHGIFAEYRGAR